VRGLSISDYIGERESIFRKRKGGKWGLKKAEGKNVFSGYKRKYIGFKREAAEII